MKPMPPRVMPALVTAFDSEGDLALADHRHNVRMLWQRSVRGFVVGGSTGEGPYLEPGERELLCVATREEVGSDAFLVCGIAAETIRTARRQLEEAAAGDADMVLVMTPTTLVGGRHELVEGFYRDVAEVSPLPVLLYTVPGVTGYELPVEIVVSLSGHANVAGIKDSSGKAERFGEWRAAVPPSFRGFCGSSRAIVASVAAGAYGAITASANYAFDLVGRCVAGDAGAQTQLLSITTPVEAGGVPGTKAAAERFGLRSGPPRAPLRPIPASTVGSGTGSSSVSA